MNKQNYKENIITIDSSSYEEETDSSNDGSGSYESAEEDPTLNEIRKNNSKISANKTNDIDPIEISSSSLTTSSIIDETDNNNVSSSQSLSETTNDESSPEINRFDKSNFSFRIKSPFKINPVKSPTKFCLDNRKSSSKKRKNHLVSNESSLSSSELDGFSRSSKSSKKKIRTNDKSDSNDEDVFIINSDNDENGQICTIQSLNSSRIEEDSANSHISNKYNIDEICEMNSDESIVSILNTNSNNDDRRGSLDKDMYLSRNRIMDALKTLVVVNKTTPISSTNKLNLLNESFDESFDKNEKYKKVEKKKSYSSYLDTGDSDSNKTDSNDLSKIRANLKCKKPETSKISIKENTKSTNEKGLFLLKNKFLSDHKQSTNTNENISIKSISSNNRAKTSNELSEKIILEQSLIKLKLRNSQSNQLKQKTKVVLNDISKHNSQIFPFEKNLTGQNLVINRDESNVSLTKINKRSSESFSSSNYYGDIEINNEETRMDFFDNAPEEENSFILENIVNSNIDLPRNDSSSNVKFDSKVNRIKSKKSNLIDSDSCLSNKDAKTTNLASTKSLNSMNEHITSSSSSRSLIKPAKNKEKNSIDSKICVNEEAEKNLTLKSRITTFNNDETKNCALVKLNFEKTLNDSSSINVAKKNDEKEKSNKNDTLKRPLETSSSNILNKKMKHNKDAINLASQKTSECSTKPKLKNKEKEIKSSKISSGDVGKKTDGVNQASSVAVEPNLSNKSGESAIAKEKNKIISNIPDSEKDLFAMSFENNNNNNNKNNNNSSSKNKSSNVLIKKTFENKPPLEDKKYPTEKNHKLNSEQKSSKNNNTTKGDISKFKIPLKNAQLNNKLNKEQNKMSKNEEPKSIDKITSDQNEISPLVLNKESKSYDDTSHVGILPTSLEPKSKKLIQNSLENKKDNKKKKTNNLNKPSFQEQSLSVKHVIQTKPVSKIAISAQVLKQKQNLTQFTQKIDDKNQIGIKIKDNIEISEFSCKEQLTLRQLNEKERMFNQSLNILHPFMHVMYLMNQYVKKMSRIGSLDFNLLLANLPNDSKDDLSVHSLRNEEKIGLCKLMSRSAGRINYFRVFGLDCGLRGNSHKPSYAMSTYVDNFPTVRSSEEKLNFILENIPNLTISESYIFYKMYLNRKSSPFRKFELYWMKSVQNIGIRVHFENDGIINSTDSSYESVVKYILHENKDYGFVNQALHNKKCLALENCENVLEDGEILNQENKIFQLDEIKKLFDNEDLFDTYYIKQKLNAIENSHPSLTYKELIEEAKKNQSISYIETNDVLDFPHLDSIRFINHVKIINPERGNMRKIDKHGILKGTEFRDEMKKILEKSEFKNIDLPSFFQS